ncbi:MAG: DUF4911 domain-containing protein [Synergistaceae bacterium]|nr:DUF4911 domain-containing protein [Synergistaceae bacterium]
MKPSLSVISLKVPQKDIYYISWTIDACEGLGLLRTDDAKSGEVTVFTPSELLGDMLGCIEGLRDEGLDICMINVS